jgi:hypothetical protein
MVSYHRRALKNGRLLFEVLKTVEEPEAIYEAETTT